MKVGKTKIAIKGFFILIVGLVVNFLCGLFIAYLQYISFYKFFSGMELAWKEFVSQPGIAFKVLVLGSAAGNELWIKIHDIYFDMRFQLVFLSLYAYWVFQYLTKSKKLKKQDASEYGSHGSARWASQKEIKETFQRDPIGFILGEHKGKLVVHPKKSELNQIITSFGGSGSGKSAGYVIPNILYSAEHIGESMIVTDPKGELYNKTSFRMRELDYDVLVFNLLDMKRSMRYNPLDYIETTEEALSLANMIISNTDGGHKGGDPMWKNAEMAYFAALMMYLKETRPKEDQHIKSILQFGTRIGRDQELIDEIFDQLPEDSEALEMYNIFRLAQDKTRAGILIGFGVRLKLWVSKNIANLTRTSDFDLNQLGKKKTILYILTPDSDDTFDLLPGLLIDQAFQILYKQAERNPDERLKIDVRVLGDEMANIAAIHNLERKASTMRSRGISIVPIFQNLTQFQNRYNDGRWSEILGSSDTIVYLGSNDKETNKYFSEELGKTTLLINSISESTNSKGQSESKSHSVIGRSLATPDELKRMLKNKCIVFQRGSNPALIDKHFYYKQTKWKNLKKVSWYEDIPERQDPPIKIFNPFVPTESVEETASTSDKEIPDFLTEIKNELESSVTTHTEEIITKINMSEGNVIVQLPLEEKIEKEVLEELPVRDITIEYATIDIESEISSEDYGTEIIEEEEIYIDEIPEEVIETEIFEEQIFEVEKQEEKGYLDSLFDDEEEELQKGREDSFS